MSWHFYPFIHWCTFGLFLPLGYYKYCSMNISVQVFIWTFVFRVSGCIPRRGLTVILSLTYWEGSKLLTSFLWTFVLLRLPWLLAGLPGYLISLSCMASVFLQHLKWQSHLFLPPLFILPWWCPVGALAVHCNPRVPFAACVHHCVFYLIHCGVGEASQFTGDRLWIV